MKFSCLAKLARLILLHRPDAGVTNRNPSAHPNSVSFSWNRRLRCSFFVLFRRRLDQSGKTSIERRRGSGGSFVGATSPSPFNSCGDRGWSLEQTGHLLSIMFPSIVARATNGAALCPCNVVGHPSTFFLPLLTTILSPIFSFSLSRSLVPLVSLDYSAWQITFCVLIISRSVIVNIALLVVHLLNCRTMKCVQVSITPTDNLARRRGN